MLRKCENWEWNNNININNHRQGSKDKMYNDDGGKVWTDYLISN